MHVAAHTWFATMLTSVVALSGRIQTAKEIGGSRGPGLCPTSLGMAEASRLLPLWLPLLCVLYQFVCMCRTCSVSILIVPTSMTLLPISIPTSVHLLMPKAVSTNCSTAPSFWCLTGTSNTTCSIWCSCYCLFPNGFRSVFDAILIHSRAIQSSKAAVPHFWSQRILVGLSFSVTRTILINQRDSEL